MMFLSIIIALAIWHYGNLKNKLSPIVWFERYQFWIEPRLQKLSANSNVRKAISIIALLIFFSFLFHWLSHLHRHLFYFIVSVAVLLYGWTYREKETVMPASSQHQTRFIFSQALSQSFSVTFWFVILGPFGVLLYDFIRRSSIIIVKQILEWPAARILGLGYALAGHFPPTFSYWSLHLLKNIQHNESFLEECGLYALNASLTESVVAESKEVEGAKALVKRAEFMLLILLLVLVLGNLFH
jgi:AmpE protein